MRQSVVQETMVEALTELASDPLSTGTMMEN
jgi:hypothetical protein